MSGLTIRDCRINEWTLVAPRFRIGWVIPQHAWDPRLPEVKDWNARIRGVR